MKAIALSLVSRLCACVLALAAQAGFAVEVMPSWNDGEAKSQIIEFVGRVTDVSSPDFVPEPERIATFDNDGTLWSEQPAYFQLFFATDRVRALAPPEAAVLRVADR